MSIPLLPINNMDARHRGLLPSTAANYLDAARVCLDRHHSPPQEFTLKDDDNESDALVDWKITTERDKNAWAFS